LHVVDLLRERYVEHRPRRQPELEALPPGVADDADDRERADVMRLVKAEVLADRILATLEEALDERFVDDRDRRGRFVVRLRERAPARHLRAEVLQVVRAHPIPRCARVVAGLGWR